jgi:hypothetical protein
VTPAVTLHLMVPGDRGHKVTPVYWLASSLQCITMCATTVCTVQRAALQVDHLPALRDHAALVCPLVSHGSTSSCTLHTTAPLLPNHTPMRLLQDVWRRLQQAVRLQCALPVCAGGVAHGLERVELRQNHLLGGAHGRETAFRAASRSIHACAFLPRKCSACHSQAVEQHCLHHACSWFLMEPRGLHCFLLLHAL